MADPVLGLALSGAPDPTVTVFSAAAKTNLVPPG
jgi:hypothetical protein